MSQTGAGSKVKTGDESWLAAAVKYAVVTVTTIFAILLAAQVWGNPYLINPVDVPDELAKSGLNGTAISGLIRDRVAKITAKARTATGKELKIETKESDANQVDVKITGTDLSVRALAAEIANLFGFAPLEIAGSVWITTGEDPVRKRLSSSQPSQATQITYHMSLRDNKGGGKSLFEASGADLDRLISDSATAILGEIDPVRAANYLRLQGESQRLQALAMAEEGVRRGEEHDNSIFFKFGWHLDAEVPSALLVQAYVLASNKSFEEALLKFTEVENAYAVSGDAINGRKYAADGRVVTLIERSEEENNDIYLYNAQEILRTIEFINYDSAKFHESDILRRLAERQLSLNNCLAIEKAEAADLSFDVFESKHNKFTIAFFLHAVMLEDLATFLHFRGDRSRQCPIKSGSRQEYISQLYEKSEHKFRQAIALDDTQADAWLQLGILIYQTQVQEPEWLPKASNKSIILDKAIDVLQNASILDPTNSYTDFRLAVTIKARLSLDESDGNERYTQEGLRASCRGYALASGRLREDLAELVWNFASLDPSLCGVLSP